MDVMNVLIYRCTDRRHGAARKVNLRGQGREEAFKQRSLGEAVAHAVWSEAFFFSFDL